MKKIVLDIVAVVFTILLAINTLVGSAIQSRYPNINASTYSTMYEEKVKFNQNTTSFINTRLLPSKGNLVFGMNQKSGTSACKYKVEWKDSNSRYWNPGTAQIYFTKNKEFLGMHKLTTTNGQSGYDLKVTKFAGLTIASELWIDYAVS